MGAIILEHGPRCARLHVCTIDKHRLEHKYVRERIEGPGIDAIKFKVPTLTPGGKENTSITTKHFSDNTHEEQNDYCLNTFFQKLHFSKSHFYETLQEKYDYVIFLQPKSRKKCHKNFENRFTNKIIMPKKYFK